MEVRVFGGIGQLVDSGPLLLAMPVAAAAGAVTFLSPCCLPLVPGYLSYLTGMSGTAIKTDSSNKGGSPASESVGGSGPGAGAVATTTAAAPAVLAPPPPRGRVMLGTLLFVFGFSVVYMLVGLALGSLGQALLAHQEGLSQILGGLVILLGLMFLGAFDRFTFSGRIFKPQFRPQAGLAGAPLLGVLFGLSWSPCIGPTLSAVLALGIGTGSSARAAVLVFVYCLGLGIPFLIVAFAFSRGVRLFSFARRHGRLITQIGGAMLIVVGLLEVTGAWSSAILWLKIHWLAGYNSPI